MTNRRNRSAQPKGQLNALRLDITPRVSARANVVERVEEFGEWNEIPARVIYVVNLEIDELLTNYLKHSLRHVKRPRLEITLRVFPERVVLDVTDTGPPFSPEDVPLPQDMEKTDPHKRQINGPGLHLVKSFADSLHYHVIDGCNHLTVEHRVSETLGPSSLPPGFRDPFGFDWR